jgi:hypothetical protein
VQNYSEKTSARQFQLGRRHCNVYQYEWNILQLCSQSQSSSNESPGEGLNERWQSFELPHLLKNLVGLELDAS